MRIPGALRAPSRLRQGCGGKCGGEGCGGEGCGGGGCGEECGGEGAMPLLVPRKSQLRIQGLGIRE